MVCSFSFGLHIDVHMQPIPTNTINTINAMTQMSAVPNSVDSLPAENFLGGVVGAIERIGAHFVSENKVHFDWVTSRSVHVLHGFCKALKSSQLLRVE